MDLISAPIATWTIDLPVMIKLHQLDEPLAELVVDPNLRAQMHDAIQIGPANSSANRWGGRTLRFPTFETDGFPVAVAFDVFVRSNGHDYKLKTLVLPINLDSHHVGSSIHDWADLTDTVDIVFRPNPEHVRSKTNPVIWGEEIVIKDIPVTHADK